MISTDQKETRFPNIIILVCGVFTGMTGFLVLVGWITGLPLLFTFGSDKIPMAPSTAILFLLYGGAVCALTLLSHRHIVYRIAMGVSIAGTLIAALLFFLSSLGIHLPAEHLGIEITGTLGQAPIGHISPVTAFCFILAGVSLLATFSFASESNNHVIAGFWIACLLILISSILLIAYLFGTPLLYGGHFIPPALLTSLSFATLGIALLVSAGIRAWPQHLPVEAAAKRTVYILFLVFIILSVGIITTGYFYYQSYERNYKAEIERQLTAIAELKVSEISQWRKERLGNASVFFENENFSERVKRYFETPSSADAERKLQTWIKKVQQSYPYDCIFLLDTNGIEKMTVPDRAEPASPVFSKWVQESCRSTQIIFKDLYRDESNLNLYLTIFVPILDPDKNKSVLGVLAMRIDPHHYLYPLIARWPTPSRSAETLLIRREGNNALFLNNLRFQKNTALGLRSSLKDTIMPSVKAVLGFEGIVEGVDYRREPVIAGVRAIPNSPWFLVARMDMSEVYEPMRRQLWEMIILIATLLFSSGAVVAFVWRHQRARFYRERYEADEALRTMVRTSPLAIIVTDPRGYITLWNRAAETIFGWSAEEATGKPNPMVPPEMQAEVLKVRQQILEGKTFVGVETERVRKDGVRIAVSYSATALLHADNETSGILAIVADVTERKRSEEKLRSAQERFEKVFSHSPLGTVLSSIPDGKYMEVNDAFLELTGFQREEVIGHTSLELNLIDPKDRAKIMKELRQTGAYKSGVAPIQTKKGETKYVRIYSQEITIDAEKFFLAIHEDITERRKIEEALKKSEERYRGLVEHASDGIFLADANGQYIEVNPSGCAMLGYTREEILTKKISDLIPSDDIAATPLRLDELRQGKTVRTERRLIRKDGTLVPVEISARMLPDGRLQAIQRDITERKKAEQILRKKDDLLAQMGQLAQVGGWEFEVNTLKGSWTDEVARIHDMDVSQETNAEIGLSVYHDESREKIETAIRQTIDSGIPYDLELKMTTVKGNTKWVRTIGQPVYEGCRVAKLRGSFQDITERKRIEEEILKLNESLEQKVIERTAQLESANKELESFSYSVSHDLRAPLRAIDGFARIIVEDYANKLDSEGTRLLNVISTNIQKMDHLIRDLLELSRTGRTELQRTSVNMNEMVQAIYHEIAPPEAIRSFEFKLNPLPEAFGDPTLLRQMWSNLLSNALKYTMPKTERRIEIIGREEENENVYCVTDSGVGFNPDYIHKLFGIFQRLHSAEEFEGTGVGLAIVQRIAHRHGGRVWAESKVGKGAKFYFTLPVKKENIME